VEARASETTNMTKDDTTMYVNVWNALEDELVCSNSLNVFKNGLRQLRKNDSLPLGLLQPLDL